MRGSDRDQAALVGREPVVAPVEREGRIALEDVEALLDGVEVRRDVAGPIELAQREAGVHRAHASPDQVRPPVPRAVLGVPLGHGRVDLRTPSERGGSREERPAVDVRG